MDKENIEEECQEEEQEEDFVIDDDNEKSVDEKNNENDEEDVKNEENECGYDDLDFSSQSDDDDDENNEENKYFLSSDSDSENNENNENDDENINDVLNILMKINKYRHHKKQNTKKNNGFLPMVKKYLKVDMEKKKMLYDKNEDKIIKRFTYLAKNILSRKIPLEITTTEKYMLQKLSFKKFKKYDRRVLLIENFLLHATFERAVVALEKAIQTTPS